MADRDELYKTRLLVKSKIYFKILKLRGFQNIEGQLLFILGFDHSK